MGRRAGTYDISTGGAPTRGAPPAPGASPRGGCIASRRTTARGRARQRTSSFAGDAFARGEGPGVWRREWMRSARCTSTKIRDARVRRRHRNVSTGARLRTRAHPPVVVLETTWRKTTTVGVNRHSSSPPALRLRQRSVGGAGSGSRTGGDLPRALFPPRDPRVVVASSSAVPPASTTWPPPPRTASPSAFSNPIPW